MRVGEVVLVLVCSLLCSVAVADPLGNEIGLARHRYETGRWLYEHERYADALLEFQATQLAAPRPEIDYNIGLCEQKLGHPAQAADAYRRYLSARPEDPNSETLRVQIARLDAEVVRTAPLVLHRSPPHRSLAMGLGVSGLVLGAASAVTGGLVLASRSDAARYDRNHALAITTDVFWSTGAALCVSGLVLYLVERRAVRR